jgi:hypothetical protein
LALVSGVRREGLAAQKVVDAVLRSVEEEKWVDV